MLTSKIFELVGSEPLTLTTFYIISLMLSRCGFTDFGATLFVYRDCERNLWLFAELVAFERLPEWIRTLDLLSLSCWSVMKIKFFVSMLELRTWPLIS